ncbi:fimbrial protein [Burkholderia pseudomultivorans]|uniref:fimbrial protein n=1 Tax=Burkholderia pseudomultivorans TaxID=1207504 RepID=UPI0009C0AC49|nr:fimbrial protein [Burkholderia pseudomultivorans]
MICKNYERKFSLPCLKIFHFMRSWKIIGMALGLIMACNAVHAACTINPNFPSGAYRFNPGMLPTINITPDMKVGDVIYTQQWSMPEWSGQNGLNTYSVAQCDPGAVESFGGTTEFDPINKSYKLPNIEGIEFQISYPANPNAQNSQITDVLSPISIANTKTPGYMVYPPASQGRPLILKLIVTGDIKAGVAPVQKYVSGGITSPIYQEAISVTFGVTVQIPTCTITNSNINVAMPNTTVADFNGIGTSPASGKRKAFDIRMNCNAVSNLKIQFDSQYARGDIPGTIDLTDQGKNTAMGIGVRMRYGDSDTPVPLGQQIDITSSSLQSGVLPMSAEYVQTGNNVKAGVANSVATFTIQYQ